MVMEAPDTLDDAVASLHALLNAPSLHFAALISSWLDSFPCKVYLRTRARTGQKLLTRDETWTQNAVFYCQLLNDSDIVGFCPYDPFRETMWLVTTPMM